MSPETHIASLSEHLTARRYDQLTPRVSFPLPVYVNDSAAILAQPEQIWSFIKSLHSRFVSAGLPQFSGKVASIELPRGGRFRMWVDWLATGADGVEHAMRSITYNRGTHADYRIEMMEIAVSKELAEGAWQNAA